MDPAPSAAPPLSPEVLLQLFATASIREETRLLREIIEHKKWRDLQRFGAAVLLLSALFLMGMAQNSTLYDVFGLPHGLLYFDPIRLLSVAVLCLCTCALFFGLSQGHSAAITRAALRKAEGALQLAELKLRQADCTPSEFSELLMKFASGEPVPISQNRNTASPTGEAAVSAECAAR
jgi:hypothetical protein